MTKQRMALVAVGFAALLSVGFVQGSTSTAVAAAASPAKSKSKLLMGQKAGSRRHFASYMDLQKAMDFSNGDRLVIKVAGQAASFVVVRLLPKGYEPDDPDVIVAEKAAVMNGIVEVKLTSDYKDIKQVSIHSGPKPFGIFDLGTGNGYATLTSIEHFEK